MHTDQQDIDKHPVAKQDSIIGQVPVIDIGELISDSSSVASRIPVEQIAAACKNWGFFQVINHGIPAKLFETVLQQTRRIFALPLEEKLSVVRTKDNPWGFYNNELTKNQRDKKEVFDFTHEGIDPIYGKSNRWPTDLGRIFTGVALITKLEAPVERVADGGRATVMHRQHVGHLVFPCVVDQHAGAPVADPDDGVDFGPPLVAFGAGHVDAARERGGRVEIDRYQARGQAAEGGLARLSGGKHDRDEVTLGRGSVIGKSLGLRP